MHGVQRQTTEPTSSSRKERSNKQNYLGLKVCLYLCVLYVDFLREKTEVGKEKRQTREMRKTEENK